MNGLSEFETRISETDHSQRSQLFEYSSHQLKLGFWTGYGIFAMHRMVISLLTFPADRSFNMEVSARSVVRMPKAAASPKTKATRKPGMTQKMRTETLEW